MRTVILLLTTLPAAPALACSLVANEAHEAEPSEVGVDITAPGAVTVGAQLTRGVAPRRQGCGETYMTTSCDDIGRLTLTVNGASDDRTAAEEIGYEIVAGAGSVPEGLLPSGPIRARAGALHLSWIDGSTDEQEPLDFVLTVTPLDRAGNRGPAATLHIEDDGEGTSGCAAVAPAGWLLLAWLTTQRRR